MLRSFDWPREMPVRGLVLAVLSGVAWTIWSEYRNVYGTRAWSYAPAMPTLFGIGVSPLLQWVVVPPITWWLMSRWRARRGGPRTQ